jgi:hypothetical protein
MENGTKPCFGADNVPSYFPQKEFQPSIQFKFLEELPNIRLKRG